MYPHTPSHVRSSSSLPSLEDTDVGNTPDSQLDHPQIPPDEERQDGGTRDSRTAVSIY